MSNSSSSLVLALSCPDRPGIVSAVSTLLADAGCNIRDAQQFDDLETGRFFMRVVFDRLEGARSAAEIRALVDELSARFGMTVSLRDAAARKRVMLLVSKFDHCLADLIYRWRIGELSMEITGIVSNHAREHISSTDLGDLPFHHMPINRQTKMEQEAELWRLIQETRTELVVLARYMQILSDGLSVKLAGRCINIHHSFLPGFKGANPYRQAHTRGVKLIGATAHFVTGDLDEGPIIEQNVVRVDHTMDVAKLVRKGQAQESQTLAEAVRLFAEHRVLTDGDRTVIFR